MCVELLQSPLAVKPHYRKRKPFLIRVSDFSALSSVCFEKNHDQHISGRRPQGIIAELKVDKARCVRKSQSSVV